MSKSNIIANVTANHTVEVIDGTKYFSTDSKNGTNITVWSWNGEDFYIIKGFRNTPKLINEKMRLCATSQALVNLAKSA